MQAFYTLSSNNFQTAGGTQIIRCETLYELHNSVNAQSQTLTPQCYNQIILDCHLFLYAFPSPITQIPGDTLDNCFRVYWVFLNICIMVPSLSWDTSYYIETCFVSATLKETRLHNITAVVKKKRIKGCIGINRISAYLILGTLQLKVLKGVRPTAKFDAF